jgi:hypothetical protein
VLGEVLLPLYWRYFFCTLLRRVKNDRPLEVEIIFSNKACGAVRPLAAFYFRTYSDRKQVRFDPGTRSSSFGKLPRRTGCA